METTLYDKQGQPTAYIAADKETIYLWSGKAAAYIQDDKVFGFNGCHLGWTRNGVFYTQAGHRVGFRSDKCPAERHTSPVKCIKQEKRARRLRQVARIRPILQLSLSEEGFTEFLIKGL
jgi:hypothetical protein